MLWIAEILIDIVSTAIILVPALVMIQNTRLKGISLKRRAMSILFAVYVTAVLFITGIPRINNLTIDFSVNIIPIIDMFSGLKATVLNIILFIPLGFLLPMIWSAFRSAKKTIFFGLGLSAAIEISQIFTYRSTDIDDLITNTIGTLLGYLIARTINDKSSKKLFLDDERQSKKEPLCISSITFLIMLLSTPYISGAFWGMVYG